MKKKNSFMSLTMKTLILTVSLSFGTLTTRAQPIIQWQKCLGGTNSDYARSIQQTTDGGYIVVGETFSNDGDVSGNHGVFDCWITKTNSIGTIQWQKCLGGTDWDFANSIQQTTDGGYIIACYTYSNNGDVSGNHNSDNSTDYWIVKLNSLGIIQWQKCLGGTGDDVAHSIQQTIDGGYIVAGETYSNDGDVSGNHNPDNSTDYWIVKLDSLGTIQWQKCLGGTGDDIARSIQQTTDKGYIIAGYTFSDNGDISGNHDVSGLFSDYWVVKLDSLGTIQWQKCLGGTGDEVACSIQQTIDDGYIIAGYTFSNDGDVSGNHGVSDYWVAKTNSIGTIQWQKCLGGTNSDHARSIQQSADGGYIIAGETYSNDDNVSNNHDISGSFSDYWVTKTDSMGTIQWQKCLGSTRCDLAHSIQQTTDGGCIIAGYTFSNDGDVSGNHNSDGSSDYWVVKLSDLSSVNEEAESLLNVKIFPNPFINKINIEVDGNADIVLFDLIGRIIDKATCTDYITIKTDVSSGIYFLRIISKNKTSTIKIVAE